MRRRGPRPLPLLLALHPHDPALIAGIAAYRRHPFQRSLPDPAAIWQEGDTRLLDYGGTGPRVLVVPSLINRATVLDLLPDRSMLRMLAAGGVRPLLLDWGWPGPVERRFTLTDYVAGRLERAAAVAGPAATVGYCMGGNLVLALAQRRPDLVPALALLATPWDFHTVAPPPPNPLLATLLPGTALPVDAIQAALMLLDPAGVAAKFRAFATEPDPDRARVFVALEDWLADGVPLAGPVAAECLGGWFGANTPARGEWRIAGLPVDPAAITMPVLCAIPARDRIVPAASALALAARIPHATVLRPGAGHVGMVAGSRAAAELWQPLLDWLRAL